MLPLGFFTLLASSVACTERSWNPMSPLPRENGRQTRVAAIRGNAALHVRLGATVARNSPPAPAQDYDHSSRPGSGPKMAATYTRPDTKSSPHVTSGSAVRHSGRRDAASGPALRRRVPSRGGERPNGQACLELERRRLELEQPLRHVVGVGFYEDDLVRADDEVGNAQIRRGRRADRD